MKYNMFVKKSFSNKQSNVYIFIHGIDGDHLVLWDIANRLYSKIGAHVLTYDLLGRGEKLSPTTMLDGAAFVQQLENVVETHCKMHSKICLIGYSMGGAIASMFAAAHPERISSLFLISSAGLTTNSLISMANISPVNLVKYSFVSNMIINASIKEFGTNNNDKTYRATSPKSVNQLTKIRQKKQKTFENKHFQNAYWRVLQQFPFNKLHDTFASLADKPFKIHILWGGKDNITRIESGRNIYKLTNGTFYEIESMGHTIPIEMPNEVVKWLTKYVSPISRTKTVSLPQKIPDRKKHTTYSQ
jgi:pimeloyl-ACP methyl ester carboxylesterase